MNEDRAIQLADQEAIQAGQPVVNVPADEEEFVLDCSMPDHYTITGSLGGWRRLTAAALGRVLRRVK